MRGALLCLCATLVVSCTDPRGRPVAPLVSIELVTTTIASPGSLTHVVTASDADGLDSIVIHVVSADSLLAADTVEIPFDTHLSSTQYTWTIPAGIPVGTPITISAEAWDVADYNGADTLIVPVQTSGQAGSPRAPPARP